MSVDISLQLRALHAIVDHFDKTGERLSDADLAIELRVTMTEWLPITRWPQVRSPLPLRAAVSVVICLTQFPSLYWHAWPLSVLIKAVASAVRSFRTRRSASFMPPIP